MSHSKSDHYSKLSPQPIEVIEAWGLDFHLGNVIKYVARAPYKGCMLEDLMKARWYLDRYLQVVEAAAQGKPVTAPEKQV